MSTILCISDLHLPFEHPDALEFVAGLYDTYEPDYVINLGDEVDQYGMSLFPKDPEAMGTQDEIELMLERLVVWQEMFPEMMLCHGNHTLRYLKRALQVGLPRHLLKSIKEFLNAPKGWEWKNEWIVDDIRFWHGEPFSGKYAAHNMLASRRQNQVHGHLHSLAGVTYENNGQDTNWVLSCGCLVNPDSYAFHYEHRNKLRPIIGTGVIVDGTPVFEALR